MFFFKIGIGKTEIGLKLPGPVFTSPLRTGKTLFIFQHLGT